MSFAAVLLAVVVVLLIALTPSAQSTSAGRIAGLGGVVFLVAVLYGSTRFVALSSLPVLGAALMNLSAAPGEAWGQSVAIGALWYLASEFAWYATEKRAIAVPTGVVDNRRTFELAGVVTISLLIAILGSIGSTLAPQRNLVVVAGAVVGLFVAIGYAARYIKPEPEPEPEMSPEIRLRSPTRGRGT